MQFQACGIDISDRAIKYASLTRVKHYLVLDKYGEHVLPEGIVSGGVIADSERLIEVLKKIRQESNLEYVIASLPEEKGYVVEMFLPGDLSSARTREVVELHLEERVPIEVSKAVFDYERTKSLDPLTGNTGCVTSVVESSLADSYSGALSRAGFVPLVFELESQALSRAVIEKSSSQVTMIVDIGREQSNLSVVTADVVHLAVSVNVGGNSLARAIQEDLHVSEEEAEKLKEERGLLRADNLEGPFESIVRVASVLRDEIWQRLTYWNNEKNVAPKRDPISRVLLCGGNASIPGLAEYLTSDMGLPVAIANPWTNIASFDDYIPPIPKKESLKYCTALGLALRSVAQR